MNINDVKPYPFIREAAPPVFIRPVSCLDHGFVGLIDRMGSDQSIVDDARVSIAGEGVKATSDSKGLIRYLMRKRHTTPIEGVVFKFIMKMPIFVARQFVRHRTATINEMSARYGVLPQEFYVPELAAICYQATDNKQGRSGQVDPEMGQLIQRIMHQDATAMHDRYHQFLAESDECGLGGDDCDPITRGAEGDPESSFDAEDISKLHEAGGLARELARINLPLSTYTLWRWQINLHNLFHFLSLRMDKHAQLEARVYGEALADIVKQVVPVAYEAFEDFRLHSMDLSRQEVEALRQMLAPLKEAIMSPKNVDSLLFPGSGAQSLWKTKRERDEFMDKLRRLGLEWT